VRVPSEIQQPEGCCSLQEGSAGRIEVCSHADTKSHLCSMYGLSLLLTRMARLNPCPFRAALMRPLLAVRDRTLLFVLGQSEVLRSTGNCACSRSGSRSSGGGSGAGAGLLGSDAKAHAYSNLRYRSLRLAKHRRGHRNAFCGHVAGDHGPGAANRIARPGKDASRRINGTCARVDCGFECWQEGSLRRSFVASTGQAI
jgi:hypothetical protein